MFGVYRTALALLVFAQHIGGIKSIGSYAVFGFYILSGYLMTAILHNTYGYSIVGFGRYAFNRILRIYPMYFASILITLCLFFFGPSLATYHECMYWPINYHDWLRIFFIYFPNVECPRFTPPAWALTVELFFYILIGLGASRYRGVTLAWFFCSILYHIYAGIAGLEWPDRYFALEAASLPFSTGAMIFHYKKYIRDHLDKFKWINAGSGGGLLFIGFLVNWYIGYKLGLSKEVFFYTNYIICACAIIIFAVHPLQNKSICSWGEWIGRFSYPIYLLHYQAGFLTLLFLKYFNFDVERPSMLLFTLTIPLLLLLSSLFIYFIERPIENFRIKVRKR